MAYATCAVCITGHLRGLPDKIRTCQRAISDPALTIGQQQSVRDFLLVELEELLGLPTGDPTLKKRATVFKAALQNPR